MCCYIEGNVYLSLFDNVISINAVKQKDKLTCQCCQCSQLSDLGIQGVDGINNPDPEDVEVADAEGQVVVSGAGGGSGKYSRRWQLCQSIGSSHLVCGRVGFS